MSVTSLPLAVAPVKDVAGDDQSPASKADRVSAMSSLNVALITDCETSVAARRRGAPVSAGTADPSLATARPAASTSEPSAGLPAAGENETAPSAVPASEAGSDISTDVAGASAVGAAGDHVTASPASATGSGAPEGVTLQSPAAGSGLPAARETGSLNVSVTEGDAAPVVTVAVNVGAVESVACIGFCAPRLRTGCMPSAAMSPAAGVIPAVYVIDGIAPVSANGSWTSVIARVGDETVSVADGVAAGPSCAPARTDVTSCVAVEAPVPVVTDHRAADVSPLASGEANSTTVVVRPVVLAEAICVTGVTSLRAVTVVSGSTLPARSRILGKVGLPLASRFMSSLFVQR